MSNRTTGTTKDATPDKEPRSNVVPITQKLAQQAKPDSRALFENVVMPMIEKIQADEGVTMLTAYSMILSGLSRFSRNYGVWAGMAGIEEAQYDLAHPWIWHCEMLRETRDDYHQMVHKTVDRRRRAKQEKPA
jgi:hypothetical protein